MKRSEFIEKERARLFDLEGWSFINPSHHERVNLTAEHRAEAAERAGVHWDAEAIPSAEDIATSGGVPGVNCSGEQKSPFESVLEDVLRQICTEYCLRTNNRAVSAMRALAMQCYAEGRKAITGPNRHASEIILYGETDASLWAKAFTEIWGGCLTPEERTMVGWFANAIETGRDAEAGIDRDSGETIEIELLKLRIERIEAALARVGRLK